MLLTTGTHNRRPQVKKGEREGLEIPVYEGRSLCFCWLLVRFSNRITAKDNALMVLGVDTTDIGRQLLILVSTCGDFCKNFFVISRLIIIAL